MASSQIPQAIRVFVHGFCFTRSLTYPYLAEQVGPLWVMRDAPRKSGSYRNEEWVAYDLAADEIDHMIQEHRRDPYSLSLICAAGDLVEPLRSDFKNLGYRLGGTEALMMHRLTHIPLFDAPAVIERVQTSEQAARLAKVNRKRPLPPEYFLSDSPLRQYLARVDDEVVGWVRSITVGNATWCENMFVSPAFRRRGIARAMLSRMLSHDRAAGAQTSFLLASHAGAQLYPLVGYEQIGTLFIFTPKK